MTVSPSNESNYRVTKTEVLSTAVHPDTTSQVAQAAKALSGVRRIGNAFNASYTPYLRFAAIGYIPFAVRTITTSAKELLQREPEKLDNVLTVISEVGALAEITCVSTDALGLVGAVAKDLAWVTPLYIVGTALSAASIVKSTVTLTQTHKLSKKLQAHLQEQHVKDNITVDEFTRVKSNSMVSFQAAATLIEESQVKNKKFIAKYFDYNDKALTSRLKRIESIVVRKLNSPLVSKQKEGVDDLNRIKTNLKNRLSRKKWSEAFSILTSTISIVAFAILFTPLAPLGFLVLGLISAAKIYHRYYSIKKTKEFEAELSAE